MVSTHFKNGLRVLALVTFLATVVMYLLEQQAQQHYLSLLDACTAEYQALPAGQPEPVAWRARCDLNTADSAIVQALGALDRTQQGLFAASVLCLVVLAVPTFIYLRQRRGPVASPPVS